MRAIIQTEMAVRKSAKAPDYSNLDHLLATALDSSGAASVQAFSRWSSGFMRDEAQTMKQYRLWKEEQDSGAKESGEKGAALGGSAA